MKATTSLPIPGWTLLGSRRSLSLRRAARPTLALLAILLIGTMPPARGTASSVPSGTWSISGSLGEERSGASAVLLADGRVLITGGAGSDGPLATAEMVSQDGYFAAAAPMLSARSGHASVLLPNGKVLVAGGENPEGDTLDSAEIYDPAADTWSFAGPMASPRSRFSASGGESSGDRGEESGSEREPPRAQDRHERGC